MSKFAIVTGVKTDRISALAPGVSPFELTKYPEQKLRELGFTPTECKKFRSVKEFVGEYLAETRDLPPGHTPQAVAEYMKYLRTYDVEEFHVALLNSQNRVTRDVLITRGLINSSLVHPREVFGTAIADKAVALVLVHNHPSGDPTPSTEDRAVTKMLVDAGKLLDIPVHDHIIIGEKYFSFAEAGWL